MSRRGARATTCHSPRLHKTPSESCSAPICSHAESTARGRPPRSPAPGGGRSIQGKDSGTEARTGSRSLASPLSRRAWNEMASGNRGRSVKRVLGRPPGKCPLCAGK